jgi:methionyl-tRNA formyltransferase
MLEDTKDTGVTIMKLDQEMDHGPIVAQEEIDLSADFPDWPIYEDFEGFMARKGAQLLAKTMPDWISGKIVPIEQDHSKATYTHKIIKEDGLIDISDLTPDTPYERAYGAFRKIQAFHQWPQAYFFIEKKDDKGDGSSSRQMRVKITQASFRNEPAPTMGKLIIEKVIPEGKKEMAYADFARSYLK